MKTAWFQIQKNISTCALEKMLQVIYYNFAERNSKPVNFKLLGKEINNKLLSESHIKTLCGKTSQKFGKLQRASNHLDKQKKILLFSALTKSQFSCCPLVLMICSRRSDSLVNYVHERALLDLSCAYYEPVANKESAIHQRNIKISHKRNA